MFGISQVSEASILAAAGVVNIFLGIMLSKTDKYMAEPAVKKDCRKEKPVTDNKKANIKTRDLNSPEKEKRKKLRGEDRSLKKKKTEAIKDKEKEEKNALQSAAEKPERREEAKEPPYEKKEERKEPVATLSIVEKDADGNLLLKGTKEIDIAAAENGEFSIGGKKDSDYVVKNEYISGTHALISERDGRFYIMDLSRNGTRISAIPARKGTDPMMYRLEVGKEEELLNNTLIELAGKVNLIFRFVKK